MTILSGRDPRNFIFQADKMTLFQKFDFGVNIKYDTGRETVKGLGYKLKVSRSSFRMHMRNRRFMNTPKIIRHELNRTSSSRPVCVTSRRPEKGLCRSDYRCRIHIINMEILKKLSMVAQARPQFKSVTLQ